MAEQIPSLGSLEWLLIPPWRMDPIGEFSGSFPLWKLSCFAGGRAAACPNLQPFVGKQPFPPLSPMVLNGFCQRGRLNPPIWTIFALVFSICHPLVLAAASLGTASSLALRPVQPNAGWHQSLQNQVFSALSLPNGCCCPCWDGELIACYPGIHQCLGNAQFSWHTQNVMDN